MKKIYIVQFCEDKRISKTPCLLLQNKDKSWSPLMYFKKGKNASQKDFEHMLKHFKMSFKGSC